MTFLEWNDRLAGHFFCRYRFAGRDWFFRRIAFDIGTIETVEIRLWMQRGVTRLNRPTLGALPQMRAAAGVRRGQVYGLSELWGPRHSIATTGLGAPMI